MRHFFDTLKLRLTDDYNAISFKKWPAFRFFATLSRERLKSVAICLANSSEKCCPQSRNTAIQLTSSMILFLSGIFSSWGRHTSQLRLKNHDFRSKRFATITCYPHPPSYCANSSLRQARKASLQPRMFAKPNSIQPHQQQPLCVFERPFQTDRIISVQAALKGTKKTLTFHLATGF